MTPAERHQLLIEWNTTQAAYPKDRCLHELFERQVERTPHAIALIDEAEQLNYSELNGRANQVAHHLQKLAVGPEVLVGISVERSCDMVVGLLGILKAGGAYVPLDATYPRERFSFMLEDAGVKILLTQERLLECLPAHTAEVVCLDRDWEIIARADTQNVDSGVVAENLAYVIYTSGSTGKPKGVAIEHRSTTTLVYWSREHFAPEQLAGVLASTSICFDLSIYEIFVPLSWGGSVILAENVLQFPALAAAQKVTLINTVPSAIGELIRNKEIPNSVRTINLAGEPLQNDLVQRIYEAGGIKEVYNLYGPTEDTTYSTYALITRGDRGTPPIGRPIANTQIYILDRYLQPTRVGVVGELYLGGEGLARGYLNFPELTAERFIASPFSIHAGARLYQTGDLARYLPNGNIEYLGRIDHQVKIRGYRIELGEIETVLSQHPAVDQSVVVAREEMPGEKLLVAYLVPHKRQAPLVSELRDYLRERLPDYMLPQAFVVLDELPRTPNGKVDRLALQASDQFRPEIERNFVAPRTPIEATLAGIWAEVLKLERVGIHDNFFELGGHSLFATRVIARMRATFRVEIPMSSFFDGPTVASLASLVTTKLNALKSLPSPEAPSQLLSRDVINQRFAELINSTSDLKVVYEDVLGEGPDSWDENLRYPQGTVNCLVWIQLLISEIYGKGFTDKTPILDRIRYYGGHVGFSLRKHYIDQWLAFEPEPLVRANVNGDERREPKLVQINPKIFLEYHGFPCSLYKMDHTSFNLEYTPRDSLVRCAKTMRDGFYIMFGVASEAYIERYGISSGPMGFVHPTVLKLDPIADGAEERQLQDATIYQASIWTKCIQAEALEPFVERMKKLYLGFAVYELDPNWDFQKPMSMSKEIQELLDSEANIPGKRRSSTRVLRPASTIPDELPEELLLPDLAPR